MTLEPRRDVRITTTNTNPLSLISYAAAAAASVARYSIAIAVTLTEAIHSVPLYTAAAGWLTLNRLSDCVDCVCDEVTSATGRL